jgi:hypothetical protein
MNRRYEYSDTEPDSISWHYRKDPKSSVLPEFGSHSQQQPSHRHWVVNDHSHPMKPADHGPLPGHRSRPEPVKAGGK